MKTDNNELSVMEVARLCNVTSAAVYQMLECGRLQGRKLPKGRRNWRIPREAAEAWQRLREHRAKAREQMMEVS